MTFVTIKVKKDKKKMRNTISPFYVLCELTILGQFTCMSVLFCVLQSSYVRDKALLDFSDSDVLYAALSVPAAPPSSNNNRNNHVNPW